MGLQQIAVCHGVSSMSYRQNVTLHGRSFMGYRQNVNLHGVSPILPPSMGCPYAHARNTFGLSRRSNGVSPALHDAPRDGVCVERVRGSGPLFREIASPDARCPLLFMLGPELDG